MTQETKDFMNNIGEMLDHMIFREKPDKNGVFHIHAYDIPEGKLKAGMMKHGKECIYFICSINDQDEIDRVLLSMIIRNPERLRMLAKQMNTCAEQLEKEQYN